MFEQSPRTGRTTSASLMWMHGMYAVVLWCLEGMVLGIVRFWGSDTNKATHKLF